MVYLKCGRSIVEIDEKDLVLDNGQCVQVITRSIGTIRSPRTPRLSQSLFKELQYMRILYTNPEIVQRYSKGSSFGIGKGQSVWAFDIKKMLEWGYDDIGGVQVARTINRRIY